MRCLPVLLTLGMGLMYGQEGRSLFEQRHCSAELEALRFVTTPQGSRVPMYGDVQLMSHLTRAYRGIQPEGTATAGAVVVPLYSADRLLFRHGPYIFVTTGLLTRMKGETELVRELTKLVPPADGQAPGRAMQALSTCGPILDVKPAGFEAVWSNFRDSLSRYEASTHLRLKRRPRAPVTGATEVTDLQEPPPDPK